MLFLGDSASAGQITEIVTAKSSWQNTGNIVKEKTTDYGHCRNYKNYGTLNKTKIRVIAKIGGDFATVYSFERLPKDDQAVRMDYTNTVNAEKIIRFCYKLPEDSGGVSAIHVKLPTICISLQSFEKVHKMLLNSRCLVSFSWHLAI